jgi:hypothetical protein
MQQAAQRLFDYLIEAEYFTADGNSLIQFREVSGNYELWMSLLDGVDPRDPFLSDLFETAACDIQTSVFSGSFVHWIAADSYFENILARYICKASPTSRTGQGFNNSQETLEYLDNTLYYLQSVTQQEAQRLLDYLIQEELVNTESLVDVQFRKEGGVYEMWMILKDGLDPRDPDISDGLTMLACDIETQVFSGSSVHVLAVDQYFENVLARYMCY